MNNMYQIGEIFNIDERRELNRVLAIVSGKQVEEFRISYVGQGQNYLIFRALIDEEFFCIRIGNTLGKENIFGLERALIVCESNGIFTNKVLFSDFICRKIHRPYMITTFISGNTYDLSEFQEDEIHQFFTDFGMYLAKMHSIEHSYFSKELNAKNKLNIREYLSKRYVKLYEGLKQSENISIDLIKLDKIYQFIYSTIDFESIIPHFIHRDISASNIIQSKNKFQCLIDFEHAIFFDFVWDFAKLELNILSATEQKYRECFMKSYQSIISLEREKDSYQRFRLYYILELMWAVINNYNNLQSVYLDILRGFIEKGG